MKTAVEGAAMVVLFAERRDGSFPAEEFLAERSARERATLGHAMQVVADRGRHPNEERFKVEGFQPTIIAFKDHQVRVFGVMAGRVGSKGRIVLTHGMIKKKDRTPDVEWTRTHNLFEEHEAVEKEREERERHGTRGEPERRKRR